MTEREKDIRHGTWTPEPTVDHWRCRGGCGALVPVTRSALERWRDANDLLAARGERPLDTGAIVWCQPCEERLRASARERKGRERAELTGLVNRLRCSMDPSREDAIIARLRELGHPDVEGFVRILRKNADARFPGHADVRPSDLTKSKR